MEQRDNVKHARGGATLLTLTSDTGGTLVLHLAVLLGTTRVPLHTGVAAALVDACLVGLTLRVILARLPCSIR